MSNFKVGDRVKCIAPGIDCAEIIGMTGTVVIVDSSERQSVGVEFDNSFRGGHTICGICKDERGWWCDDEDLELLNDDDKIVITIDGNTTIAKHYKNGKILKTSEAKCSPDDKFDFMTGAMLAMLRLHTPQYKVGDYVKIREDLKHFDEFHAFKSVYGACDSVVENMKKYAGTIQRIKEVSGNGKYKLENVDYWWVDSMFEGPAEKPVEYYNGKVVCLDNKHNRNDYTVGKIYKFQDGMITTDDNSTLPCYPICSFDEWKDFSTASWLEIVE